MMLPTPFELKEVFPLTKDQKNFVLSSRKTIQDLLSGKDPRIAIVVGPCSIHDKNAALEYARHFKELSLTVAKSCFLVMRVYMEKSRTTTGWKGYFYDPHLDGTDDIRLGMEFSRELLLELAAMEIPTAAEFVDPIAAPYFSDLISWGFIGARTSSSQPHRQLSSLLRLPIGFKNATDGNVDEAIHGVIAAQNPHKFLYVNEEGKIVSVQSEGNACAHVVLRGSYDTTNYDSLSVTKALQKMKIAEISTRLLIDCSHGNCRKQHGKQRDAFFSVIEQVQRNPHIAGVMLESHLQAGSQSLDFPLQYAVSITDPCIDWATTMDWIIQADHLLSEKVYI